MASDLQKSRLRSDLHLPESSPLDLDDYFLRGAEEYPSNSKAAEAYTRVLIIMALMSESAPEVTYSSGASSESKTDVSSNLERLLKQWEKRLEDALGEDAVLPVDFGGIIGARPYPDNYYPNNDNYCPPNYEIIE